MNKTILKLAKLLPGTILSGDIINNVLENEIKKVNFQTIYLDFSDINFISRSAAHELLKMKGRFEYDHKHKKEIIFKDLSPNVAEMIRIVASNNAYAQKKEVEFKPKRINIKDLVKI